jgi:deoxycytidine triphosphate deaminase
MKIYINRGLDLKLGKNFEKIESIHYLIIDMKNLFK